VNQHLLKLRRLLLCDKLYYFLFIIAVIYFIISTIIIKHKSIYDINKTGFDCVILNYKVDGNKANINLRCKEKLVATLYFKKKEELIKFKRLNFGDKIHIKGTLEVPKNSSLPNTFNYKKYLYNNKIYYKLNIEDYLLLSRNKNIFYFIKNSIYNKINKIKNNEYIYAFVLGQTSFIDSEVNDIYRYNGVTHLFALSGSNVALIYILISFILKKLKFSELSIHTIVSLILLLIIFITGFSPSIIRASIFFILYGINSIFYFNIKSINILLLTFFIIVIFNPYIIYNIGFQLSFIITMFLILYNSLFNSKNKVKNLFFVGLISFLASCPIVVYNFYYLNFLSLINNLIFVPLVSYIVFPLSLLTFVFPFLSNILNFVVKIMESISLFLSNIKIFSIIIPKISLISIFIYYIFLLLFKIKSKKRYLVILFLCLFYTKFLNAIDNNCYIYFLDVGQGDSIYIKTPNKNIMIDTGGRLIYKYEEWQKRKNEYSYVKSSFVPFINSIGEEKIDYLFLTHGDYDHVGEAVNLVNNFKVDKVIFNVGDYNNLEQELIGVLNEKSIDYIQNIKELNVDKYKLYFLNTGNYDNENDNSSVIYFNYNGIKFLFMGDAGLNREKDILEKYNLSNMYFLKIGHHGSKTSSSKEFIDSINPKYSLISVGEKNKYGHPNNQVLENLSNSKIYRTDKDGSILIKVKNNKFSIKTYVP
jgi:competence protein ComEC